MKALITGVTGFAGNHLARLLLHEGWEVFGTRNGKEQLDEDLSECVVIHECDIRNSGQIREVLTAVQPKYIFHLAGQSSVANSWKETAATFDINVVGTARLLDELILQKTDTTVILAGSAEEYGRPRGATPLTESEPLDPINPYGVSKAALSMLFKQYHLKHGLELIYARAFNHIGPGQRPGFVTVDFARQLTKIKANLKEPVISVGNLETVRDFTDVRDIVKAYLGLAKRGCPGEVYNVCSGNAIAIKDILCLLIKQTGVKVEIKTDPDKMRPAEVPVLVGNNNKICNAINWKPERSMQETLQDLINYWTIREGLV